MGTANLPGQLELPTVIDHQKVTPIDSHKPQGIRLATLLRDYDKRRRLKPGAEFRLLPRRF